ncbi:hypothetical protein DC20_20300 [Rufibacter tibetensis]|uniref:Uncharacterized protein n=2 Tax=Rufibacter tibetensis TaxID=512763 RepID=A0A0P0CVZ5_9BACT|nr:hypothetical protein DC20_20300 [Rufibacter tibetensis]
MNVSGKSLITTLNKQFHPRVALQVTKKPGGQTSRSLFFKIENFSSKAIGNLGEFSTTSLSEGFVLDGFFLGTFEFDSLTGHPGIRY